MAVETETVVELKRRKFTVDEYYRLVDAGILMEDDRVELIRGEIIEMSPIGDPHNAAISRLSHFWMRLVNSAALVWVQNSFHLFEDTEPQPDILIVKYRADHYRHGGVHPGDVLLVMEVADTSLAYDRGTKAPLYGRAGIPEAWVWDLDGERLYVHRDPGPDGYQSIRILRKGDVVRALAFPDHELSVGDFLD